MTNECKARVFPAFTIDGIVLYDFVGLHQSPFIKNITVYTFTASTQHNACEQTVKERDGNECQ